MQINPLESGPFLLFEEFDQNDPKNLGRPLFFRLDVFIATVEMLIASDEIELALKLLDMVPAWYRENYPQELVEIKKTLYKNCYDSFEYASDPDEAGWSKEAAESQFGTHYTYPRAEVLREVVAGYNNQGKVPWVCELSTSHGLLPLGLQREGHKFNFFGKNLNHPALVKLKGWLEPGIWKEYPEPGQPKVFVFTEALEHTYDHEDLRRSFYKLGIEFDDILLSVPNGTLGGGLPNWKTRRIGHIRTYTLEEFWDIANDFFPGYEWKAYRSVSHVLHGKKRGQHVDKNVEGVFS